MGPLPGCICYIHLQSLMAWDQESVIARTTTSRSIEQKCCPNKCFVGSTTALHKEQFALFVCHGIQNYLRMLLLPRIHVYTNEDLGQNILLSIKMGHIQVLIPNENVLTGLHNIWVQKPLSIPPAAKWAHQCSTLTTSTHHSQHLISKGPINFPLIQTNKPSRLLNVLDKELTGSTDVKI
jgi:hypothetical protein